MQQRFKQAKVAAMLRSIVRGPVRATLPVCLLTALAAPSWAAQIETDVPDLKLRWDTTVGYSLGFRTERPSAALTQGPDALSYNDGDLNFTKRRRPITNRFDLFTEADLTYRGFGARASAAAWYDIAYNTGTSNTSALAPSFPAPYNPAATLNSGAQGEFPDDTRDLHGRKAELLDAFVFGKVDLGSVPVTARLGRHGLIWGETLFFGANGIASGMAPVDIIKLQSSPNSTFKEIIRPVNQISAQAQLTPGVSVAAYYQLAWEKSRLPAVGSFYSVVDALDVGGQRALLANFIRTPSGPLTLALQRTADKKAPDSGQGGVSAHWRLPASGIDLGAYAIQYNSKFSVAYATPNPVGVSTYQLLYPEKIRSYAVSANTTVFDDINVGSEVSIRTNAPLARGLIFLPGPGFDANDNPAYPVGRTMHVNLSAIMAVPSYFLARESNLVAEIAWNRVLSCTKTCDDIPPSAQNPLGFSARDKNATRDASSLRVLYTPVYRQAFSGVDLSVPVGISYSPEGRSEAVGPLFVHHGGDMSLGLSATVREAFTVALNYTHYYGPEALPLDNRGYLTFGQSLRDRDNVTLSARFSF